MGPNANGYLANHLNVSVDEFIEAQLGMLRELLTNYGTDYVSRLWWDHDGHRLRHCAGRASPLSGQRAVFALPPLRPGAKSLPLSSA